MKLFAPFGNIFDTSQPRRLSSFRKSSILCVFFFLFGIPLTINGNETKSPSSEALLRLMEGNRRFVEGKSQHQSLLSEAKAPGLENAVPFAVVVGCSDARVPPEILFDQGLGDLFIVRVAGNVIGPIELDTVEFAVAKLNVPLVIVLGHQNCKAVEATLKGRENVPELDSIYPLIDEAFKECPLSKKPSVQQAIECNVKHGVKVVESSQTIAPYLTKNQLQVVGAYYDLNTRKVTLYQRQ